MKSLLVAVFALMPFILFAQPVKVPVRPMQDYHFIGDNAALKPGVNCMVITNRKQFEKTFGKTDRPDTPSFANELMLVLLMPETRRESRLYFERISMKAGEFIEVYCKFDLNIHPLTYRYYPIITCAIPRFAAIHKINFYNERHMRLLESVLIK